MTTDDRLYAMLPAVYRVRDAEIGSPLRGVLDAVARSLDTLEGDIDQLYDDLFVETCQDRLLGHFADLVGLDLDESGTAGPHATSSRRRQVLDALAERAATGTLSGLERVAADVTGWPVRADEDAARVAATPNVRAPWPAPPLPDLRAGDRLVDVVRAFSTVGALADVRRGGSHRTPAVGPGPVTVTLTLWRLPVAHVHRAPACCVDDDVRYTFDPLGRDRPLAVASAARRPGTPPAGSLDVPAPITRAQLRDRIEDYYGPERSLCVYRGRRPVSRTELVVADLSDWGDDEGATRGLVAGDRVALDPETGRFLFGDPADADRGVWVRYHHLDSGPMGAGGAGRRREPPWPAAVHVARDAAAAEAAGVADPFTTVGAAVRAWRAAGSPPEVPVRILDSAVYQESLAIRLAPGEQLTIRAAAGARPVLRAVGEQNQPQRLRVTGPEAGSGATTGLTLDGLRVAGGALELAGHVDEVTVRSCTLATEPDRDDERRPPSLVVAGTVGTLAVLSSVVGWLRIADQDVGLDPPRIVVCDSVLDGGTDVALGGPRGRPAEAVLDMTRSTAFGDVVVARIGEAPGVLDSIVTGTLRSEHRQHGEVRFSSLGPESRTPRRTACQPDGVLDAVTDRVARGELTPARAEAVREREVHRIRPRFVSTVVDTAGYARLADDAAAEIRRGASDEGEPGALHDQWLSRRVDDLRARLGESIPVGVDLDIVFAD